MTQERAAPEVFDALEIELKPDGSVWLTAPDYTGNGPDVVRLHPLQVRRIAQLAGIDLQSDTRRALARLQRQVLAINDHAQRLAHWMCHCSDHDHADLTNETHMARAIADLAGLAAADVKDDEQGDRTAMPERCQADESSHVEVMSHPSAAARTGAAQLPLQLSTA